MRQSLLAIAVVGLLSACGGSSASDACNNFNSATNKLFSQGAACFGDAGSVFTPNANCSGASNVSSGCATAVNNYASCLNAVPACTPATEQSWSQQVTACDTSFSSSASSCH